MSETLKMKLHQWRAYRDISQADLAELVELTPGAINYFENKSGALLNAKYKNLKKIADALEIEIEQIIMD